ncbi:hypothetical protein [Bradyrhizobium sp. 27S5]|uniref:hypothetical protein n=1 Tax=Bradyrhizobium sp. 27S5 TaxID=3139728 RepID=UPI0030CC6E5F
MFGFIVPDDGGGRREENLWFGGRAANGVRFYSGDRVDYDPGNYRPGKGPTAARVRLIEPEAGGRPEKVTTIWGEVDV